VFLGCVNLIFILI